MPLDFEDINKYNSELLNLLTTNLPDMLWAKDLDGKYIYVNQAICSGLLMAKDTHEPIGKGDVFLRLGREKHIKISLSGILLVSSVSIAIR